VGAPTALRPREIVLANCRYCGKPAGFLHFTHPECERGALQRERDIRDAKLRLSSDVSQAISGATDFDSLEKAIVEIGQASRVPVNERKALLARGWANSVNEFLAAGVITVEEERRLLAFNDRFGLTVDDLDKEGVYLKFCKSSVLRDVLNGIMPQRFAFNADVPINLQKGEQIVWEFPNCKYLEDKVHREYVGASHGASVRIMKGVYYHVGAFKGEAVEHSERVHLDTGWVVITNKHIYFAGPVKSFRIAYAKIVSFESFSNGIGLFRDTANAKSQFMLTGDGWFTYNLVTNLSRL
jgi:hypothetical protein